LLGAVNSPPHPQSISPRRHLNTQDNPLLRLSPISSVKMVGDGQFSSLC